MTERAEELTRRKALLDQYIALINELWNDDHPSEAGLAFITAFQGVCAAKGRPWHEVMLCCVGVLHGPAFDIARKQSPMVAATFLATVAEKAVESAIESAVKKGSR